MTTAQILKRLEAAKSEQEMLTIAVELGVTPSFSNIGSAVETKAEKAPPPNAKKLPPRRKQFGMSLGKKKPTKKATTPSA